MFRAEFRSLVQDVGCSLSELSHPGQMWHRNTLFFFVASDATKVLKRSVALVSKRRGNEGVAGWGCRYFGVASVNGGGEERKVDR